MTKLYFFSNDKYLKDLITNGIIRIDDTYQHNNKIYSIIYINNNTYYSNNGLNKLDYHETNENINNFII